MFNHFDRYILLRLQQAFNETSKDIWIPNFDDFIGAPTQSGIILCTTVTFRLLLWLCSMSEWSASYIEIYMDFIRLLFRIYNILLWSEWTYSYQFFWYSREVLGNQIIFYLFTDGIMTITQNKKWNRLFQLMNVTGTINLHSDCQCWLLNGELLSFRIAFPSHIEFGEQ